MSYESSSLLELLNLWEPCLRRVEVARAKMVQGQHYTPLREEYESACNDRDARARAIESHARPEP